MSDVIKKLYYSIGEVSEITELKQYVLRYWENEFDVIRASKNRAGNRIYTKEDIDTILIIKKLLYVEKYTIEGAKKKLKAGVNSPDNGSKGSKKLVVEIKSDLKDIIDKL